MADLVPTGARHRIYQLWTGRQRLTTNILVTGACGFVGCRVAIYFARHARQSYQVIGIDNLVRAGSELNRSVLDSRGVQFVHADIRQASDLESFDNIDWVIDCAALPSVLGGIQGHATSRRVAEHNLLGTLEVLELCRRCQAGLILLSTSRVYSIDGLRELPLLELDDQFTFDPSKTLTAVGPQGIREGFSTRAPVSLYGATKLASEAMAAEYALAYEFPLRINRCGILAGAWQFARQDQGIVSYWIHSYATRRPLQYRSFGGTGKQVRDLLHPDDLIRLIEAQIEAGRDATRPVTANVSGGAGSAFSLQQLSNWCAQRFSQMSIGGDQAQHRYDLPWIVLDASVAQAAWNWQPKITNEQIFEEIAQHAEQHPEWLRMTS